MTKIFESPDGGHTIYIRESGSSEKTLYSIDEVAIDRINYREWNRIWFEKNKNPTLKKAVDTVIMIYRMSKENEQT